MFFMDLKTYLATLPGESERAAFAVACGSSLGHFRNCIYQNKRINPATCVAIERVSAGAVARAELRPEDWQAIWPELIPA